MTLEDAFYISQTIASVAVVGSLIYVGLQVRYAERSQRGLMQQARADRTSAGSLTVASPELARIWTKGSAGDADLTSVELAQWLLLTRAAFLSGEDSILQYKAGLMSEETYETYIAGARFHMMKPGFRAAWNLQRMQFGAEFRAFGDAILNEVSAAPAVDGLAQWNALVRAERASAVAGAWDSDTEFSTPNFRVCDSGLGRQDTPSVLREGQGNRVNKFSVPSEATSIRHVGRLCIPVIVRRVRLRVLRVWIGR